MQNILDINTNLFSKSRSNCLKTDTNGNIKVVFCVPFFLFVYKTILK